MVLRNVCFVGKLSRTDGPAKAAGNKAVIPRSPPNPASAICPSKLSYSSVTSILPTTRSVPGPVRHVRVRASKRCAPEARSRAWKVTAPIATAIRVFATLGYGSAAFTASMRVYGSHHEDVDIPQVDILTLLFESKWCAAKEDTQIHVEAANPRNSITKAQARNVLRQIAYSLRNDYDIGAAGAGQDVVLAVTSGNPFIPVLFYAIVAAGGVYSGASTAFTVNELVKQIRDADAKLLLCSSDYEQNAIEAAKQCSIPLNRVLIIDATRPHDWNLLSAQDHSQVLDLQNGQSLDWKRLDNQRELEDTTTCLLYSSGTTGLPKGVRISQRNLVACNVCGMRITDNFRAQCRREEKPFHFTTIAHLPMAHIGGISWSSMNPFYMGGTAYWVEKYDFESFSAYHRKYRLTCQWSVPPIWLAIAKSPKVTDHFDSLRIAVSGAAPMGTELAKEAASKLGKGQIPIISQFWGSTETTGSISGIDWDVFDESYSSGAPFPNVKLRFLNEDNKDVEPGQPGEVLVAGPIVCQGYHKRPDATRDSFFEGFYRTGDIGIWRDGRVYIIDRLKELIKYKGLQVAPAELEAHLLSHPKINDAAVIGVYDDSQATEVPKAFVVTEPGYNMKTQEIIDFVRDNLANHKRLRGGIVFVQEIPKSVSGKILRKELRARTAPRDAPRAKL